MCNIPKYEELEQLSNMELVHRYNITANTTQVGTSFYLDELSRRKQNRLQNHMLKLTKTMKNLTVLITILTVVNIVLFAIAVLKG